MQTTNLTWFVPGVGEFFHFTWGLERKQGPCIWGIITFFFYSKANAPYFPGVGVSIDRCITMTLNNKSERNDGGKYLAWPQCYYSYGPHMEDLTVPPTFLVRGKRIDPLEYFLISELCHRIFIKWLHFASMSTHNWMVATAGPVILACTSFRRREREVIGRLFKFET